MVTVRFKGDKPQSFYKMARQELIAIINDEVTAMETELVQATPGDRGGLRRGWSIRYATSTRMSAAVGQSSSYFLATEIGRRPGTGISAKGQEEVAKWALRKKIIQPKGKQNKQSAAKSFAFLLSQKYKREGRPAMGYAGLAKPGSMPPSQLPDNLEPVGGPIMEGFNRLKSRLR